MQFLTILFACAALLVAGLLGIALSVPLQAPTVILVSVAAVFAAMTMWQNSNNEKIIRNEGGLHVSLFSLVVISMVFFVSRAWWSPVRDLGVEDLMLILPAGILYIVAGHVLGGKSGICLRLGLAWVVVLLLLMHLGSCLMQLKGGEGYSLSGYFLGAARASQGYVTGMYGYYGSFANFAVIAGLLCMSFGIWGRLSYGARMLLFLIGLLALGLAVFSKSRSAVVSVAPALVVFLVLVSTSLSGQRETIKKWSGRIIGGVTTVFAAACLLASVWVFQARAGEVNENDMSPLFDSVARLNFWPMAFEQWLNYPVFGAGARSFSYQSYLYWNPNLSGMHANPEFVHNEYLQLLTDYGLVGLLLIISVFVLHGAVGVKTLRRLSKLVGQQELKKGSNAIALTIAGLCGMTAMAVHICFDFRTHIQANLLLLVCCAVWILPLPRIRALADAGKSNEDKNHYIRCQGMALLLMATGLGAIMLGGQQLWAGWPLIENRIAKEDGAWEPAEVDRSIWIPILEESLDRAPQWRRYQRLGTMYRLEAMDQRPPEEKQHALNLAEKAYSASLEQHSYNPIVQINLAAIYKQQKRWQEADAMYESASAMAKAREPWFGMYSQWAQLHQAVAFENWQQGQRDEAHFHFSRAKELYEQSREYGVQLARNRWGQTYTQCLISYADFLDGESSYAKSQELLLLAKGLPHWASYQKETRLNFYHARHYYRHGISLWHERKPKEAYQMMLQAEKCMAGDERFAGGSDYAAWEKQMGQIREVIHFFKTTGIAK